VNAANPAPGVVTAAVAPTAPLTTSGVKAGAPMDLTGLFATPVVITDTNRSTVRLPSSPGFMCCVLQGVAALHAAAVRHHDDSEGLP
jgi:hypothetical protein